MKPKPTIPKLSMKNSTNQELAHIRERGNSNWLNPCKGVLLYPHDARTMRLTQPITPGKGYSRQPFPTRLKRWGYAQLARGDLVPPRTSLNFPTHSSTRGPAKPPCIARWPRIWDRAPMIKSKKVFGLSVPLYWICGSTEKCSKPTSSTRSLIDPSGLCPCDFIL